MYKNIDSYGIQQENYLVEIFYEYYYESETRDNPEYEGFEVTKVELNGEDITDFWWDMVDKDYSEEIMAQERDNR